MAMSEIEKLNNIIKSLEKENKELKQLHSETERLSKLGSYKINLDTGAVKWTQGLHLIFGLPLDADPPTVKSYYLYVHPDDYEKVQKMFNECVKTNAPFDLKYRIVVDGNTIKKVHSKGNVIVENGNKILLGFFRDITEESNYQQNIVDLNERMKLAFEAGNMSWWEMHLPSGKVEFGENKVKMLGRTPEGFDTYKDFMEIVHPDDYENTMQAMFDHLDDKKELYKTDYRIKSNNGNYFWYRDLGRIVEKNEKGLRLLGIVENIQETKKLKENVENLEKQKNLIIESSTELISYYNLDLSIVWSNNAAASSVGKTTKELVGLKCYEVWHNAKAPCKDCPVLKTKNTLLPQEAEMKTTDGRIWHIRSFPVFDNNNKLIALSEFGSDITERKRKDLVIEESEKKYKNLVENTPFGVVVFSKEKTLFANQSLAKMLEIKNPETICNKGFLNYIHPKEIGRIELIMNSNIDKKPYKGNSFRITLLKGTEEIEVELLMIATVLEGIQQWQCIVQDISKVSQIESKAKRLSTDALYLSRKLSVFTDIKEEIESIIEEYNLPAFPFRNLLNLTNTEMNFECVWRAFQDNFEVVYDDFFKKLLYRAPNLTQQELKHCAYIKMNFETKDIANMFNVKHTSVQTSRVRMKKS
jgi:PAS domain S-box-containing protein